MKSNLDQALLIGERKRLGTELKEARIRKGLNIRQLAALMGIDAPTVSKIEAGKWNFGIDTLNSFAAYLDFKIQI